MAGARPSSFVVDRPKPTPDRVWSSEAQAIFEWFATQVSPSDRALVVEARAGVGKTTCIIEAVGHAPESNILLCAFNKGIADELQSRLPAKATAKTLHALGFAAIRANDPRVRVLDGSARGDALTAAACGTDLPREIARLVTMLHTKGREMCPTSPTLDGLVSLAYFFDLTPDEGWAHRYDVESLAKMALAAMKLAADPAQRIGGGIDYADMIYLPLVQKLMKPTYDMVVVDEAQDMTVSQLEMARGVCKGRIVVVGDNRQAIYGFRGADSDSLDRLKAELHADTLPLTMTYRCGKAIVERAQALVPDIVAHPDSPVGEVASITYDTMLDVVKEGDFVLSRINAPLVATTLRLLARNTRATMKGRDIGQGIRSIVYKLVNRNEPALPIDRFIDRLDAWKAKQTTRLAARGLLALVDRVHDQYGMLLALADEALTTADLLDKIQYLFTDDPSAMQVVCSSVHKAKGLESSTVYVLADSFYRRGRTQEEDNIFYVAITRAKLRLVYVHGGVS